MPTFNQLVRKGREQATYKSTAPATAEGPQHPEEPVPPTCLLPRREASAPQCRTATPKKPNSALRKIARVPPDQRLRSHRLYPRRRPQPAGALRRHDPRRPCQGPARRALPHHPRHARYPGREWPYAGPFQVRCRSVRRPRRSNPPCRKASCLAMMFLINTFLGTSLARHQQ